MDFRNLPCTCRNLHKWVINLIDHHTKFGNSHPLHAKSADEVLDAVKNYCFSYGYQRKILIDNGSEFCNAKLKLFCKENQIKLSHGAARTPTTQGLLPKLHFLVNQSKIQLLGLNTNLFYGPNPNLLKTNLNFILTDLNSN